MVLLPLGAIGVLLMVIRVAWFERYRWATLAVVAAGHSGAEEVWENEYGDGGRREYPGDGYQDDDD